MAENPCAPCRILPGGSVDPPSPVREGGPPGRPCIVEAGVEPEEAEGPLAPWVSAGLPWIALSDESGAGRWVEEGAWAVLPAGIGRHLSDALASRLFDEVVSSRERNPLTGLPGNSRIRAALQAAMEGRSAAAYVDITDFKPFNDFYGFARGDAVIRTLAEVLTGGLHGCFVGHLGGDDFVCTGARETLERGLPVCRDLFRKRVTAFYGEADRARGGIEALDRFGRLRFFPFVDICTAVVDASAAGTAEDLAGLAGMEKKRLHGDLTPGSMSEVLRDSRAGFLERAWRSGSMSDGDLKASMEAAGITGDRRMSGFLSSVLAGGLPAQIRKSAALSLGRLGMADACPILACALGDPNPHVRNRAVEALSLIADPGARILVEKATADRSTWVRRAALRACGRLGTPDALSILCDRASSGGPGRDDTEERRAALDGLAVRGDPDAFPMLRDLTGKPGFEPFDALWRATASCGGDRGARLLMEAYSNVESVVEALPWVNPAALSGEVLGELETFASGLLRSDRPVPALRLLAGIPGPAGRGVGAAVCRFASTASGGAFGLAVTVMEKRGVRPGPALLRAAADRHSREPHSLHRDDLAALLRLAAGGPATPGSLLGFLRSDSRETAVAAARTVLQMISLMQAGSAPGDPGPVP